MANDISNEITELINLDFDKVYRENYGEVSLSSLKPTIDNFLKRINIILTYSPFVDRETNSNVSRAVKQLVELLKGIQRLPNEQFVSNQNTNIQQINNQISEINKYWPHYGVSAIEQNGFFEALDNQQKLIKELLEVKYSESNLLKQFEEKGKEIISNAELKAGEISNKLQQTAQKISVKEAQDQFNFACTHHLKQIKNWAIITILLVLGFIGFIIYLLNVSLPNEWTWKIIYYTAIRIALLSLVGVIIGFSIKILKAHLHMYQHNLHRRYVANSITAFVESASTPEQRDIILNALIDSVVAFGQSGIIDGQEDSTSKITIDNITKSIGGLGNK